jgi:hypothetical protein
MATAITLSQITSVSGDGAFIHLLGAEFGLSKPVSLYVGGIHAGELTADEQGNIDGQIQVPRELAAGVVQVFADDHVGGTDGASFTVSTP